jgi:uncharacterized YkwD family protein
MKVNIKKSIVILFSVSLLGLSGCGANGTPLGNYNVAKKSTKNVVYTKHGKISGTAANSAQQNLSYDPTAQPSTGQQRPFYWPRFWGGWTSFNNAPSNTVAPNPTPTPATNPTPGSATDFPNQDNNTPPPLIKQSPTPNSNLTGQPNPTTPDSVSAQVIQLVNQERKKNGLPALLSDSALIKMANMKTQDMLNNNYFSHQSPTYGSPFDMMNTLGITYTSAGENIAEGQTSAYKVMTDWMNSPGHRANILSKSYTRIGVGHSTSKNYWVQEFIGK